MTEPSKRPCRVCVDFTKWRLTQTTKGVGDASKTKTAIETPTQEEARVENAETTESSECPLDLSSLGRCTWSFLHTMAAYLPEEPTPTQQSDMRQFMSLFGKYFPCDDCSSHLREQMTARPIATSSRIAFSRWLCEIHNDVNRHLGKEAFDCSKVDERWRDGWSDGSCD
ncbi:FAD-linked sulfhydryl oxidase ALR-like [Oscarella lobularis]|uniref:FAD-linked sulfhydryl oxidase ALR-like n=1 Tax=Oscarella lobularis TaxID=121494 RepID=UPI0033134E6F